MNKKKLLFVIHRLDAGGAEKSIVSLLNSLPLDHLDIDLLAYKPTGIFRTQIPKGVNFVETPSEIICETEKITNIRFWKNCTIKLLFLKVLCIVMNRFRGKNSRMKMSHNQFYNEFWKPYIPVLDKEYDVAISYIDGCNYYVIDHVKAKKKILWCHNDYNKLDLIPDYDLQYYNKCDHACTISEICCQSLRDNFPSIAEKFEVVENISSSRIIFAQANMLEEQQKEHDGYKDDKRIKLLSMGRLVEQKGYDMAIEAAKKLKDRGLDFCWYIIGDGELRETLKSKIIKNKIDDCFILLGVRSNPYPYIKQADIFVMPSRYEGKSIALDEAKILRKPIIVTKYPSVYDAIEDRAEGIIVDINADSIADGITELVQNSYLQQKLTAQLASCDYSNEKQVVGRFLKLIN